MTNGQEPAFQNPSALGGQSAATGLTKREHFAIMIYCGMSAIPDDLEARKYSARLAVDCADTLIIELSEKERKDD